MFQYLQYLVFVGAAGIMVGAVAYAKETIQGRNKPNRVSWLLWSAGPLIATFAGLNKGIGLSLLPVFMSGFGSLLVFLASFVNKNSYWQLKKFDYLCGLFSIIALIAWGITRDPVSAIVFAIVGDSFAVLPTLVKCWTNPETESAVAYNFGLFNALTSFAAIRTISVAKLAFPVYLTISCAAVVVAFYKNRIQNKYIKRK